MTKKEIVKIIDESLKANGLFTNAINIKKFKKKKGFEIGELKISLNDINTGTNVARTVKCVLDEISDFYKIEIGELLLEL